MKLPVKRECKEKRENGEEKKENCKKEGGVSEIPSAKS